jgi:hypothetical protein
MNENNQLFTHTGPSYSLFLRTLNSAEDPQADPLNVLPSNLWKELLFEKRLLVSLVRCAIQLIP